MRIENDTLVFEAEDFGITKKQEVKFFTMDDMIKFAKFYADNKVDEWLGIRKEMLAEEYDGDEFMFNLEHPLSSEDFCAEVIDDDADNLWLLDGFLWKESGEVLEE